MYDHCENVHCAPQERGSERFGRLRGVSNELLSRKLSPTLEAICPRSSLNRNSPVATYSFHLHLPQPPFPFFPFFHFLSFSRFLRLNSFLVLFYLSQLFLNPSISSIFSITFSLLMFPPILNERKEETYSIFTRPIEYAITVRKPIFIVSV